MSDCLQFYIDGRWVAPSSTASLEVINPATEQSGGRVTLGSEADVDRAVRAARSAFASYSQTTKDERLALLARIIESYKARADELAEAVTAEMGAPVGLSRKAQTPAGLAHFVQTSKTLKDYAFCGATSTSQIVREPIGVCGFITPWNWPLNQIACKVAPALAAGCTMVLKPSEMAPLSAHLLTQILHDAGVPAGVFNLVHGDGPTVGQAIAGHPEVDMVSFTGSTRAGVQVAKAAAATVKRVTQELGGKSPNLVLADADIPTAVRRGVRECFLNSGQSCDAPTRMLVPRMAMDQAIEAAKAAAETTTVGDPHAEGVRLGPVASRAQFEKVQALIQTGLDEGAELVSGGPGRPDGLEKGFYVKPTVFAGVTNDMTIAREEIFGPVLVIIGYDEEDEAVAIANDTPYGLAAYVQSEDLEHAHRVAKRLRAGAVHLNRARVDFGAPFGGYKQSGNGREWGKFGLEEFLEVKAILAP